MVRKLAAGNWKMNGMSSDLIEVDTLVAAMDPSGCKVLLCPPATLIRQMWEHAIGSELLIGAQDCDSNDSGAHTGDISAAMLADAGASHVIVGHSERRAAHSESDAVVRAKTIAAHQRGLTAIVCVGETDVERDQGQALEVVKSQLLGSLPETCISDQIVIAYEPVWAIGTGRIPTSEQIAEMHAVIRETLTYRFGSVGTKIPLLYGGSVKPDNAATIFAISDVDGALVGGASLKATDFIQIIKVLNAMI